MPQYYALCFFSLRLNNIAPTSRSTHVCVGKGMDCPSKMQSLGRMWGELSTPKQSLLTNKRNIKWISISAADPRFFFLWYRFLCCPMLGRPVLVHTPDADDDPMQCSWGQRLQQLACAITRLPTASDTANLIRLCDCIVLSSVGFACVR